MPATITMTETALLRLLTWLSPSYPVGAYSYSHGLEWAVETGLVRDRAGLEGWIADLLTSGGGWSDAVLFRHGWLAATADDEVLWAELCELASALPATAELHLEATAQGAAFARVTAEVWPDPTGRLGRLATGPELPYPLAVGAAAALHLLSLEPALAAYLHAFAANLVSAGVRLVPLGQTDGQRVTAALVPVIEAVTMRAATAGLDELGTCTLVADWCSMRHETQYTRLFRS